MGDVMNHIERHRHSIRLKDYDYSQPGMYFATICTRDRELYFDRFPILKNIVEDEWKNLPQRFPNIMIDEYVIMPNHFHSILIMIDDNPNCKMRVSNVGATLAVAPRLGAGARPAPTVQRACKGHKLGDIIGQFKSLTIKKWLNYLSYNNIEAVGKFWQRNYYEHIICNDGELSMIRNYIISNPIAWDDDIENPKNDNK